MMFRSGKPPDLSACKLLVLAALLLAGCESPAIDTSTPEDSLLVAVLADLYLEEASFQLEAAALPDSVRAQNVPGDLLQPASRDSIIKSHNLTDALFLKHMAPYMSQPLELQQLYDRVLDRLNLERQQVQEP